MEGSSEFKIVCPFHEDVNPSMLIDLQKGTFKCFGCGEIGNALKFVQLMNRNKLDDLHACIEYFKILRSKKANRVKIAIRHKRYKPDNAQALIEASDYYYGLKTNDWNGISAEREYMLERGFYPSTLEKCKAKINYNNAYPLIFPMLDMGEFKGWVCRTMDPIIQKKRKYLYNEGFSRSNTLVGRYDNKAVMVVEGYMDWLKCKQYGIKFVVAVLGWKMTELQIQKLKKQGVKYIISALDNDEYGRKGTAFLKRYFEVIRFQFPANVKDPGEMCRKQFQIANRKTKQLYKEATKNGFIR